MKPHKYFIRLSGKEKQELRQLSTQTLAEEAFMISERAKTVFAIIQRFLKTVLETGAGKRLSFKKCPMESARRR